jgi:hypothetical protein
MGRAKKIVYQGREFALYKGETAAEFLKRMEPKENYFFFSPPSILDLPLHPKTDVPNARYYVFHILKNAYVPRNSFRRDHDKSRSAWFYGKSRPRFGIGSGRRGGAAAVNHQRWHLRFWPGTDCGNCPACSKGLSTRHALEMERRSMEDENRE